MSFPFPLKRTGDPGHAIESTIHKVVWRGMLRVVLPGFISRLAFSKRVSSCLLHLKIVGVVALHTRSKLSDRSKFYFIYTYDRRSWGNAGADANEKRKREKHVIGANTWLNVFDSNWDSKQIRQS